MKRQIYAERACTSIFLSMIPLSDQEMFFLVNSIFYFLPDSALYIFEEVYRPVFVAKTIHPKKLAKKR